MVCNVAVYWKNKTSVDDALDVFPTHGVGGIFGTVLTGVFVNGLFAGNVSVFLIHLLAVVWSADIPLSSAMPSTG